MKPSTSAPSPLSPTRWPAEAFLWWRSLAFAGACLAVVGVMLLVIGGALGYAVVSGKLLYDRSHPLPATIVAGSELILYLPLVAVAIPLFPWLARRSLAALGLHAPRPRDLAWGAGGALAMFAVTSAIGLAEQALTHQKVTESAVEILRDAHGAGLALFVLLACAAAPFVEELLFRGFVFNAMLRYTPPLLAGAVSALIFGLAHFDPNSAPAVIPLAAGGAVLCWVYYRTGTLWANVLAHALFNVIGVVGVVVLHQS